MDKLTAKKECIDKLFDLSKNKGYISFDDMLDITDIYELPIQFIDRISESLFLKGVLIKETNIRIDAPEKTQIVKQIDSKVATNTSSLKIKDNTINNLIEWLKKEEDIHDEQKINGIISYIESTAYLASKTDISHSLLQIEIFNDFINVIDNLKHHRIFIEHDKSSLNKYSTAIDYYIKYLKFNQSLVNSVRISMPVKEIKWEHINVKCDIKLEQSNKFKAWLQNEKRISDPQIIDSIMSYIESINYLLLKLKIANNLFGIFLPNSFSDIINKLNSNKVFTNKDILSNNKYSNTLELYLQYLIFDQR